MFSDKIVVTRGTVDKSEPHPQRAQAGAATAGGGKRLVTRVRYLVAVILVGRAVDLGRA
jgi:hypothetical protein